ncbi:hypothetical protein [Glycomyces artemisiae]|uniref:Uncharacterized protein n=1 Tax=Glycomyces artemisiae TaxID=1076443 RepID=A0A2T0UF32_9ACTN|nr:hypothetical protein [Glycomyces artemisiae]PRY56458.1 hypothetical protein B0I28_109107 [Glycomyces artemisiae]
MTITTGRMDVRRTQTDTGTTYEPPLDPDWDELDRLRWHAGVVHGDTGIGLTVAPAKFSVNGVIQEGHFNLWVGDTVVCPGKYSDTLSYLNGIALGARGAPSKDLCCTHGERIDRLLDLLEDLHGLRLKNAGISAGQVSHLVGQWQQGIMTREEAIERLSRETGIPAGNWSTDLNLPDGAADSLKEGFQTRTPALPTLEAKQAAEERLRADGVLHTGGRVEGKPRMVADPSSPDCLIPLGSIRAVEAARNLQDGIQALPKVDDLTPPDEAPPAQD